MSTVAIAKHLHDIRSRAGIKKPRRRRKIPKQAYPKAIEKDYADQIANISGRLVRHLMKPLIQELPHLLASAARSREDSVRLDAGEGKRVRDLAERARDQMKTVGVDRVEALAKKFAQQTSSHQRIQLNKQVKAALGVNAFLQDKGLKNKIDHFVAENVSLITSIQQRAPNEIEKIVTRAITSAKPYEEVAQEIVDRFDVEENHAKLIARDQIGKLYGQINASRQKEIGVTRFIWRTVGDERVRDEHSDREDESEDDPYSYDDPPDGELPGEPIQCRCHAEPVFDSIEELSSEQ